MQYIRKQYSSQNKDKITALLSNTSPYELNPLERTMIKSILHTLDNRVMPSDEEMLQLTDYLFKIEKWGYYEIILLANCVRTIHYNTCFLLTKEMLKNYIYSSMNKTNKRLVTQLAINCLIVSVDKSEFDNCTFLINEIEKLLDKELNYYEQTVFVYARGYWEFKNNHLSKGIEKMEKAMQIFEILGESQMKSQYLEHYKKHVKAK
ncbi:transcriptional activator, Rgg/GadR/MutR family, C-terminal domain protein [Streptococcus pseudoporcinus LQ 940-04]|uniref:Transcriptional activator, Rgg/GadR/MutR family, C-terminal domain protein n=1 Tax=Streptococcus pseudoporcinus LQ 940-04 TaxID=875093 RepID=G5KBK2_9STRE|nr:transcriptional activator, Rgg/GadR/MutR family, C-terminal domain protein [Streptococcus pseudoporcinus LQ 940-04]